MKKRREALTLRKGIVVIKVIDKLRYLIEDVLDNEIINVTLFGKAKLIYPNIKTGDEIYVLVSKYESNSGRMILPTEFKMNDELLNQKLKIDRKQKKKKKDISY